MLLLVLPFVTQGRSACCTSHVAVHQRADGDHRRAGRRHWLGRSTAADRSVHALHAAHRRGRAGAGARAADPTRKPALFLAMERRDQRHALEVLRRLRAESEDDGPAGGGAAARLRQGRGAGLAANREGAGAGAGATGLAVTRARAGGAPRTGCGITPRSARRRRQAAGCSAATVRLIRGRVEQDEAWMYALLCRADDAS